MRKKRHWLAYLLLILVLYGVFSPNVMQPLVVNAQTLIDDTGSKPAPTQPTPNPNAGSSNASDAAPEKEGNILDKLGEFGNKVGDGTLNVLDHAGSGFDNFVHGATDWAGGDLLGGWRPFGGRVKKQIFKSN